MLPKQRVGLSPIWGGLFILLAVVDLYIWSLTHKDMQLLFAGTMALIGFSNLFGVLLLVDGNKIELKNPIGMTMRTFVVTSPKDLEMEGRKLFINADGQRRKVSGLMANGAHWRKLGESIASAKNS